MYSKILEALVEKWNEENKCDKCWKLVRTFNDHMKGQTNLYNPKDDCCTYVFLEGVDGVKPFYKKDDFLGIKEKLYCEYYLHLKIAEVSDFQNSKADEYNCPENITDNVIIPLQNCVSCGLEEDLCDLAGGVIFEINDLKFGKHFYSLGDSNWAGLDLRLTIRVY